MNKEELTKAYEKALAAFDELQATKEKYEKEVAVLSEQMQAYADCVRVLEAQLLAHAFVDEKPTQ